MVYEFLIPLLFGFACNLASAFTAAFSQCWGARNGALLTFVLRNVLGIPVWAVGMFMAFRAPQPPLFDPGLTGKAAGWGLVLVGGAVIVMALFAIRGRAAAPSMGDTLVQTGVYARVRHPIHSGTLLEFGGLFLFNPSAAAAVACALGVGWVLLQTRFEEIDLAQRLPGYRDYMRRVPRFVPRLW